MQLPKEFENRMKKILGEDYEAFAAAMETPPVRALRLNTIKSGADALSREELIKTDALPFCREGYIFDCEHIGSHPLHHAGAIYVQEPAAMAAVECTEILPGMRILDLCASPGGKTTQAAAKLFGSGVILSNEIDRGRCKTLAGNVERMGIRNAIVSNADSALIGETYKNFFDLIIVDAPCSGEGMMRKNPLAVSEWSLENIEKCARRQQEILENIADSVKFGGHLLYSTCTFAPEENELQISRFLRYHPDFHLVPVRVEVMAVTADGITEYGEEMRLCRRFYPHVSRGEGQFMALLMRDGEAADIKDNSKKKPKEEREIREEKEEKDAVRAFISEVLSDEGVRETEKYKLIKHGEEVYLVSDIPLPQSGALMAPGVAVGHLQKGRIIPHHSFFMAYGAFFKRIIRLHGDDPRIKAYLHGESIRTDCENGYAAVLYGDASMGGAKVTGGEAKNYYPKGLRNR